MMMAKQNLTRMHIHADALTHDHLLHGPVQIVEPSPDDAAAEPKVYEDLEAQLWQSTATGEPTNDVDEVLHCVAGIELDG